MIISGKMLESHGFSIRIHEDEIQIFPNPDLDGHYSHEKCFPFQALDTYFKSLEFSQMEQDRLMEDVQMLITDRKLLQLIQRGY